MKKKRLKELQDLADSLPICFEVQYKPKMILGQELLDKGEEKLDDGTMITKGMKIKQSVPYRSKINHYKRLKKAMQKGGERSVAHYVEVTVANAYRASMATWPQETQEANKEFFSSIEKEKKDEREKIDIK